MRPARTPGARGRSWLFAALLFLMLSAPVEAWAAAGPLGYVGPGAGLSMLGALVAVVAVVFLGLLAPILYPIKLLRKWRRSRKDGRRGAGEAADVSPAGADADRSSRNRRDETALPDSQLVDRG